MLFRFTLGLAFALLFGSKPLRQCILRYKLPRAVYIDAYFPLNLATAVITASKVVMTGKINDNINTAPRIINELNTVLFVAIPVSGSVWRRSVFVYTPVAPVARTRANRKAIARDEHKRCANQNNNR
jgi:hypothetical protein